MDKSKLNFIIDALMTLLMAALAGIGFLVKYVLITGKERIAVYGRRVELYFLGMDRHEWGAIHYYLGLALAALVILHVVLHWPAIVGVYRRLIPARLARNAVAILFTLTVLFLLAFALLARPRVEEESGLHGKGSFGPRPGLRRIGR